MKLIRILFLIFFPASLFAQKNGTEKQDYFILDADYLYQPWLGQKFWENHLNKPSTSGPPQYSYVSNKARNTSGGLLSLSYRHYLNDRLSIQCGADYRYSTLSFWVSDSLTNGTMSPVIRRDLLLNTVEASTYLGLHIDRWSILSGIISPIVSKPVNITYYNTGAKEKRGAGSFNEFEFCFSEKLQYTILMEPRIAVTAGTDVALSWLEAKFGHYSPQGYMASFNAGITWMLSKKRIKKKK